jgi:CRP/FNR family transcriptional regulator
MLNACEGLLESAVDELVLKAGKVHVAPAGGPLWLVSAGCVCVRWLLDDGRQIACGHYPAGTLCAMPGKGAPWVAVAHQEAVLHSIPRAALPPRLYLQALETTLERAQRRLQQLLFLDLRGRLLALLAEVAALHGEPTGRGTRIDWRVTHNDLATLLGATREATSQTLLRLKQQGLLAIEDRRISLKLSPGPAKRHAVALAPADPDEVARVMPALALPNLQVTATKLPREQLWVPEPGLYFLRDGPARAGYLGPDGKLVTLEMLEAGALFGALGGGRAYCQPLRDSLAYGVSLAELEAAVEASPALLALLEVQLGRRFDRVHRRLRQVLLLDLKGRVLQTLHDLADEFGEPVTDGTRIALRLTHQDLAEWVGATRAATSAVLSTLRTEGKLAFEAKRAVLLR